MSTIYSPSSIPLRIPFVPNRRFNFTKPIRIRNQTTKLTDYQIEIDLNVNNFAFEKARPDGADIRFQDANGKPLSYWIESWTATNAKIWVKLNELEAYEDRIIWLIYGNYNISNESNGTNTFIFSDDFESGSVASWTTESGGAFSIVTTPIKYGLYGAKQSSTSTQESYRSFVNQTSDFIIEMWAQVHGAFGKFRYIMIENAGGNDANCVKLQWNGNTKLTYNADDGNHDIMNVGMDTWYQLKFLIHPSSDTFDLWIDGISKVTSGDVMGTIVGGCSAISFYGYLTSATYPQYVDSIFLRRYVALTPLVEIL